MLGVVEDPEPVDEVLSLGMGDTPYVLVDVVVSVVWVTVDDEAVPDDSVAVDDDAVPDDSVPVDDDDEPLEVSDEDVDKVFVVARVEELMVTVMVEVLPEEEAVPDDSLLVEERLMVVKDHEEVGGGGMTEYVEMYDDDDDVLGMSLLPVLLPVPVLEVPQVLDVDTGVLLDSDWEDELPVLDEVLNVGQLQDDDSLEVLVVASVLEVPMMLVEFHEYEV